MSYSPETATAFEAVDSAAFERMLQNMDLWSVCDGEYVGGTIQKAKYVKKWSGDLGWRHFYGCGARAGASLTGQLLAEYEGGDTVYLRSIAANRKPTGKGGLVVGKGRAVYCQRGQLREGAAVREDDFDAEQLAKLKATGVLVSK